MPLARIENIGFWVCFIGAFLAIAAWESSRERRTLLSAVERRWKNHGVLFIVGALFSGILLRFTPVALALLVSTSPYGVLNREWLPYWLRCVLTVLALDFVQYASHWTNHHLSWLWRVHQVHHSDADFDVSTGVRFHPLEAVVDQGARLAAIALLAPPALGVLIHEFLAIVINFAQHANALLPSRLDHRLRYVFATPDVHRLHHSLNMEEQQHNYGEIFVWWDRLFKTYREQPAASEKVFRTGLAEFEKADTLSVRFLLMVPFRGVPSEAASSVAKAPETAV